MPAAQILDDTPMAYVQEARQEIARRSQEEAEPCSNVLRISRRFQTAVGKDIIEALSLKRQRCIAVVEEEPRDIQSLQFGCIGIIQFRRHGEERGGRHHLAQFWQIGEAFHDEHGECGARRREKAQQATAIFHEIASLFTRVPQCILRAISRAFSLSSSGV